MPAWKGPQFSIAIVTPSCAPRSTTFPNASHERRRNAALKRWSGRSPGWTTRTAAPRSCASSVAARCCRSDSRQIPGLMDARLAFPRGPCTEMRSKGSSAVRMRRRISGGVSSGWACGWSANTSNARNSFSTANAMACSRGRSRRIELDTPSSAVTSALGGPTANLADNGPHGADLYSTAATYIGITVDQLRTELGTTKSLADVAVAHGKTRDGLIQALMAAEQTNLATLVDQKGAPQGRGPGGPGDRGVIGDSFAAAATYLGTTTADLRTKMQAGQTLAQIAAATSGKTRDGLVAALTADAKAKVAAAQAAGTITTDQATQLGNGLADRIARLVDSTRPAGPGFGR